MKKKIELNKKTIKRLKLALGPKNDRKVAPVVISPDFDVGTATPTNGRGCINTHGGTCW